MLDVANRVIMVSGASRGIGRAIVDLLLAEGYRVSAGVRDPRGLTASDRLLVQRYDAESTDSAAAWVDATLARFGALDGLVNAAGINPMFKVTDTDETELDRLWTVNVKGPLRLSRLALPHLGTCGAGRVVTFSSLSGKRVRNASAGYQMTKFAVIGMTHALRLQGWDAGIRATALCPGFVETDMTASATFPRNEMTKPEDLAALVATLLRLPNTAVVAELLVNCRFETVI